MAIHRHKIGLRMAQACISNGMIHLAGQVPEATLDQGIAAQAQEVLDRIDRLLAEVNSDKSHILSCLVFLKDLADFDEWNTVWDRWLVPGHVPTRTTVQAQLVRPQGRIEVTVVASQP